jgi:thioredoxin reductase (NADPH)
MFKKVKRNYYRCLPKKSNQAIIFSGGVSMTTKANDDIYDIAIIGCGPAGFSAAINGKIRNKKVLLLGSDTCAEKTLKSPHIENYLGFPAISGPELRENFYAHIEKMGISVNHSKVTAVYPQGDTFSLQVKNDMLVTKTVIITAGVTFGGMIPGEAAFLGRGVSYCATCDGPLYKGKEVAVIVYDPAEEEEVVFLSEICSKVYFIQQYKELKHSFPDNVEIITDKPTAIIGDMGVKQLQLGDRQLDVPAIFVLRKAVSPDQLVPGLELEENHIKVNRNNETNIPGMYAAGDITGRPYQIAKAVGEGLVAALTAASYLDKK